MSGKSKTVVRRPSSSKFASIGLKRGLAREGARLIFHPGHGPVQPGDPSEFELLDYKRWLTVELEIDVTRNGLSSRTLGALEKFGVRREEIAIVLDISTKSIQRKEAQEGRLSISESNSTLRLVKIISEAAAAIGERDRAMAWMRTPAATLGHRTPFELLATDAGTALVRRALGAIEYGGIG